MGNRLKARTELGNALRSEQTLLYIMMPRVPSSDCQ